MAQKGGMRGREQICEIYFVGAVCVVGGAGWPIVQGCGNPHTRLTNGSPSPGKGRPPICRSKLGER